MNKTKSAGEIVQNAINLNPKDVVMHTKLGDVFNHQDDYENAESEYNSALSYSPDYVQALSGLAATYEATDRDEDALKLMEKAEDIAPDDDRIIRHHVRILLSVGQYEKAGEKIQKIVSQNPDDVHALNLLSQYYICVKDEKKALGCMKKIKTVNPAYSEFYKDVGKRYNQIGDYGKAEESYLKYISNNPENVKGIKYLAKNYEDMGDYQSAVANYKKIQLIDSNNKNAVNSIDRVNERMLSYGGRNINTNLSPDEEFGDVDDDFLMTPLSQKEESVVCEGEETVDASEMAGEEPEVTSEELENHDNEIEKPAEDRVPFESGFETLQKDEITDDMIFEDGRLDEEIEATDNEKYTQTLDDLVSPDDIEEDGTNLVEDNTRAEDFFAQNPFNNGTAPLRDDEVVPVFENEEDFHGPMNDNKAVSLDDGWDVEEEKEELEQEPKKPEPKKKSEPEYEEEPEEEVEDIFEEAPRPKKKPVPKPEPEVEEDDFDAEKTFEEAENPSPKPRRPDFAERQENSDHELLEKMTSAMESMADKINVTATPVAVPMAVEPEIKGNSIESLFKRLKYMSNYLPDETRSSFNESETRIKMDYILSKLEGREGLLSSATNFRAEKNLTQKAEESDTGLTLLLKTLTVTKDLIHCLDDETLALALTSWINNLVSRL